MPQEQRAPRCEVGAMQGRDLESEARALSVSKQSRDSKTFSFDVKTGRIHYQSLNNNEFKTYEASGIRLGKG